MQISPGEGLKSHPALASLVEFKEPSPGLLGRRRHGRAVGQVMPDAPLFQACHGLAHRSFAVLAVGLGEGEGVDRGIPGFLDQALKKLSSSASAMAI